MYKYQPLDSERKEIRLLEILSPGTDASPTICQLSTVSLTENENVAFAALSYVWGDSSITADIILDGTAFSVTTNLAMALRYVKRHWQQQYPANRAESFRLWVDAICINQSYIRERNNQVQMMGSIYSMAEVVFSWLGTDEKIGLAMQTIRLIYLETRGTLDGTELCLQWMEKHPSLCIENDEFLEAGDVGNKAWMALWHFFLLPYWSRTWIFQEVALARNLVMICNSDWVSPRSMIEKVWRMISDGNLDTTMNVRLMVAKERLVPVARKWRLLILCQGLYATDPRDHIYGLLAVIERDCEKRIVPDYAKTLGEVYCDSVSCWVDEDQTLEFLCLAGIGRSKYVPDQLPTWVPDFSHVCHQTSINIAAGRADRWLFWNIAERISVSTGVLQVKGVGIDVVQKLLETPNLHSWQDGRLLSFCFDFIRRHPIYINGVPPLQAIYHTLMMTYLKHNLPDRQHNLRLEALAFLYTLSAHNSSLGLNLDQGLDNLGLSTSDTLLKTFETTMYLGPDIRNYDLPNLPKPLVPLPPGPLWDAVNKILARLALIVEAYHFIETSEGHLGLAPKGTEVGDVVCVLKGSPCPVLLREIEGHHILIGTSHIYGLMEGEAATMVEMGKVKEEWFEIW